ncbi:TnsA-like heteromeric transposase endonuclease subunit [Deinococcus oregonensis]|uniref:TnsA-like heteromeric transposase endonuclease subunit n=1 Tax=Deinococcus oregonensis TaxID=1805970 RepID=A0ABV6AYE6_9DEIO
MKDFSNLQISFKPWPKGEDETLLLSEIAPIDIHKCYPMRRPTAYHGQKHFPNLYFFQKTKKHIVCESLNEKMAAMVLDFSPSTRDVSSQPFALHYIYRKKLFKHYPDFYVTTLNEEVRIIDVKTSNSVARFLEDRQYLVTAQACTELGWSYEVVVEPSATFAANLHWLADYRHGVPDATNFTDGLIELCGEGPQSIGTLSGDSTTRLFVRPVLFWLIWCGVLTIDLTQPLTEATLVRLRT